MTDAQTMDFLNHRDNAQTLLSQGATAAEVLSFWKNEGARGAVLKALRQAFSI